jgi:hypothetical protein
MTRSRIELGAVSVLVILATVLSASAARAQSDAPPAAAAPSSPSAPVAGAEPSSPETGAGEDHERFCRAHWFAVDECHAAEWSGPRLFFGIDLGVAKMNESGPFGFDTGVGTITEAGPSWGVRVGVEVLPWLAFEARYLGVYAAARASASTTGSVGLLTTGAEGVVRLTAPLPFVHPYVFGGFAYYDVALSGSSEAKAGSVLFSSSQPGVPIGFGLDVPLTGHLSVGAEATYHFMLGEVYSNVTTNGIDGGDVSTFNAVLRARL